MPFIQFLIYNAAKESEIHIVNLDRIEFIAPHMDVTLEPGAVATKACEFFFVSGASLIVLIDIDSVKNFFVMATV